MRRVMLGVAALVGSCANANGPAAAELLVAGRYEVSLAYRSNTCAFADPLLGLTVNVNHTRGANTFTLTDANASFTGTIDTDGAFRTNPLAGTDSRGNNLSEIRLMGRFTRRGFDADLGVDVAPPTGPGCRYVIGWTGVKSGDDNVIP